MKRLGCIVAIALVAPGSAAGAGWVASPAVVGPVGYAPEIAVNARGDGILAWCENTAGARVVAASFRAAGAAWGAPVSFGTADCSHRVGIDAAGNAVLVARSSGVGILARRRVAATGQWGALTTLRVDLSGRCCLTLEDLDVNDIGDAVVAWIRPAEFLKEVVEGAVLGRDGAWGEPTQLSAIGGGVGVNVEEAHVALDEAGNATAIWDRGEFFVYAIPQASHRPASGTWSSPVDLAQPARHIDSSRLAVNAAGDAIAVWHEWSFDGTPDIVRSVFRPRSSNSWEAPSVVPVSDPRHTLTYALGLDGARSALVAATTNAGLVETITRSTNGAWSDRVVLGSNASRFAVPLSSVEENGAAFVAWTAPAGTYAARRPASASAWEPAQNVGLQGVLRLATRGPGDAMIARQVTSSGTYVDVLSFDASAPSITALRAPRRAVVRRAVRLSASATDAWTAVDSVAWRFGDGYTARGRVVRHAWRRPGRYRVTATATDLAGNTTSATATIVVERR